MADLNATQRAKLEEMIALLGTDTDLAVGEKLGVHSYVVGGMRKILGVPVFRGPRRGEPPVLTGAVARRAYETAARLGSYADAAREIGNTYTALVYTRAAAWAKRRGLPPAVPPRWSQRNKTELAQAASKETR